MRYNCIRKGRFICRTNRFVAEVEIDGVRHICHVKNTGRCKELLLQGAEVILEKTENTARKTEYDLVAVYKNGMLINMDSQAPNKVFGEWARKYFPDATLIKPEYKYKNSRFDFYIEEQDKKILIEVKGVTLEENGVVMFPDAPTERGVKHVRELIDAVSNGYEAYIFFVIQMEKCRYFTPNRATHLEFAEVLELASKSGVNVRAVNCRVSENGLDIDRMIEVK